MKNQRNICAATEAGYIEYQHLPGAIKTGCQSSPLSTSKYCYQHAPRVCARDKTSQGLVKLITGKKVTRNEVYYEVKVYELL